MKSIHGFHFVKKHLLCHANFSFQIYFSCSAWPCSEVRCPHLCFPDVMMSLEWWLSQACLHISSLRNQLPQSHPWSLPFQPGDLRPGCPSLTSCVIFGSHLDSYLVKGLDLIRGKQQVRCMLQGGVPRASSIKWKQLCVWRPSNICAHAGVLTPEPLGDGPALWHHPHGLVPNTLLPSGQTEPLEGIHIPTLSFQRKFGKQSRL